MQIENHEVHLAVPTGTAESLAWANDLLLAAQDALADAEIAESEYDGQACSFCTSCGANDLTKPVIEHRKNCSWLKVRAAIARATSA